MRSPSWHVSLQTWVLGSAVFPSPACYCGIRVARTSPTSWIHSHRYCRNNGVRAQLLCTEHKHATECFVKCRTQFAMQKNAGPEFTIKFTNLPQDWSYIRSVNFPKFTRSDAIHNTNLTEVLSECSSFKIKQRNTEVTMSLLTCIGTNMHIWLHILVVSYHDLYKVICWQLVHVVFSINLCFERQDSHNVRVHAHDAALNKI